MSQLFFTAVSPFKDDFNGEGTILHWLMIPDFQPSVSWIHWTENKAEHPGREGARRHQEVKGRDVQLLSQRQSPLE